MNRLTSKSYHTMLVRVITSLVLVALVVPCIFLGSYYFFVIAVVFSILSCYEMVHACNKGNVPIICYILSLAIVLFLGFGEVFLDDSVRSTLFNQGFFAINKILFPPIFIIISFLSIFLINLFSSKFTIDKASYIFAFSIYLGLTFQSFLYLRYLPNNFSYYEHESVQSSLLFVYVVLGVIFNDIGAYFFGVLFGKHQMTKKLSPHKTWEGFVGGFLTSFVISFLFAFLCSYFNVSILPNVLDFSNYHYWNVVILSLIMPICAVFGDLLFSSIKRFYGLKDFSNILPGHGGVLDRIDSLSFTALFITIILYGMINGSII